MFLRFLAVIAALLFPTAALAEWWEAKTDNFIVYSESSSTDAREFAEKLERFDQALRSLQNMEPGSAESDSTRLTVFRTGKIASIGRLAGSSGIAGFYIPRHDGPVAFTPAHSEIGRKGARNADRRTELDPQTVLFHEYAHHFMFQHFAAAYPSWYVEGLAELYSTIDLKDDGTFHLGNAPQSRGAAFSGLFNYSVQRMLQTTSRPGMEDFYGRYSYGWLLTHYLTFESSRQGQLQTFLKLINAGSDPAEAATQSFGDLRILEGEVNRYLKGQLPGALVRPANYKTPRVTMRMLGPDEEAIIRVRMRSKAARTLKNAKDLVSDARAVSARYPKSFAVQVVLSQAELDAENLDAAERAADAALALQPNAVEAHILKGRIFLERGKADPGQNAAARTWLIKAHNSDSANPSVLYYNYLSHLQEGTTVPESAIIGLERAFMLASYDVDLRLAVVRQLLVEKDGKVAARMLAPLVHSPHESKSLKALREVYDLIDANKTDDAYRVLTEEMLKQDEEKRTGQRPD